MAFFAKSLILGAASLLLLLASSDAQLSATFYDQSCPKLQSIVRSVMQSATDKERRMGASILRLAFHDCFVQGCDASILLDDAPGIQSEKTAAPNFNSARGFDVIDEIKSQVEDACRGTVSCADILQLAARDGVNLLGGPSWTVQLGRRDSTTASKSGANSDLPSPFSDVGTLISKFGNKGVSARDMTALSGAHTIGLAHCPLYRDRIYGDTNIDAGFAMLRQQTCPRFGGDSNVAPFDRQTPMKFDNAYYGNLMKREGLLQSDQELFSGSSQETRRQVSEYSANPGMFTSDFVSAMVRMANISPLTGNQGEIRLNCRKANS